VTDSQVRGDVTVLYVAGWMHSGTTILGNILGELDGFFAAGELRHFWRDAGTNREPCGCGAPLLDCPVWRAVLTTAFGDPARVDFDRLAAVDAELLLNRRALRLLRGRALESRGLDEYLDAVARLYAALVEVTGCPIIVDTSKSPLYALLLGRIEQIDLRVLQLVRDPRGWMYSRIDRDNQDIGWVTGLLLFDFWHALAEARWRGRDNYALLRYEDFASHPVEWVGAVARLAGAPNARLPFSDERHVSLHGNHNVNGNRNRTVTGSVEIRPDVRWRHGLPLRQQALGAAIAWPLLLRHGYLPKRRSENVRKRRLALVDHSLERER
jgi:Sulfotransferase domain